jgi:SAM-dependent methyltransferase
MIKWLRANRNLLEEDLKNSPKRHFFSPAYYSQYKVTLPYIREFATGKFIDLGCGTMPYRDSVIDIIREYHTLDLFPRREEVTYTTDIQDMSTIKTDSYDSAICLEVLEHIPDPFKAISEIHRILKPGGVLILSVPHLSRLHDEPNDYYRFTSHGLRYALERVGFIVLHLEHRGGLFSFIGHQISNLILSAVWRIPILRQILWWINSLFVTRLSYAIDQILDPSGIFSLGYTAVVRKHTPDGTVQNGEASLGENRV